MKEPENVIPYHELPPETPGKVTWVDGKGVTFEDGRTVASYRCVDAEGIFIKITSPVGQNQTSELKFRLSDEAAAALVVVIADKLPKQALEEVK